MLSCFLHRGPNVCGAFRDKCCPGWKLDTRLWLCIRAHTGPPRPLHRSRPQGTARVPHRSRAYSTAVMHTRERDAPRFGSQDHGAGAASLRSHHAMVSNRRSPSLRSHHAMASNRRSPRFEKPPCYGVLIDDHPVWEATMLWRLIDDHPAWEATMLWRSTRRTPSLRSHHAYGV